VVELKDTLLSFFGSCNKKLSCIGIYLRHLAMMERYSELKLLFIINENHNLNLTHCTRSLSFEIVVQGSNN